MGLFDRFKGKKTVDWSAAYTAEPKFYGRPDGTPFGAIALTEGTETVLPTAPQAAYQVDGQPVAVWRMVIVSTTRGGVLGDADYFAALEKAAPYRLDGRADAVLLLLFRDCLRRHTFCQQRQKVCKKRCQNQDFGILCAPRTVQVVEVHATRLGVLCKGP